MDGDPEGVWSPDIEQSFQEALAIYPPCGRRKIILSDEGKMYGRNELIARYIKLRTGKTRTRKQVITVGHIRSNHSVIQHISHYGDLLSYYKQFKSTLFYRLSEIATFYFLTFALVAVRDHFSLCKHNCLYHSDVTASYEPPAAAQTHREPAWHGRSIGTTKLRLVEFSSFLETQREQEAYNKHLFVHISQSSPSYSDPLLECVDIRQIYDKFPEKKGGLKELFGKGPQNAFYLIKFWADLNQNMQDDPAAFYGVTSQYESSENMTITCSTKVCSFGKQVVEKVETEYARFENGRFVYRISRSPMCEYMINFIHKLKHLPEKYMMNSVLENFTILLVVSNRDTQETLLCMACVFEVSNNEHGAQHHIYRLVKE
uniref:TEA domain-containing protein n=1 Tax=Mola mola TaxID=94237 RepID=A0A3Q4BUX2_MOLML